MQHTLLDNGKRGKKNGCGMSWSQCGLKYLGIFLGNESTNQKNWENVCENVEGRLEGGNGYCLKCLLGEGL